MIGVGLVGCGVVGSAVARAFGLDGAGRRGSGGTLSLVGIAIRDPGKERPSFVERGLLVENPLDLARDPRVDVLVEAISDVTVAVGAAREALHRAKHVVTANKQLVAAHGPELEDLAERNGVTFSYEASVAAAVPVVHVLRSAFAGDRILGITGVLNGTTNFVLCRMAEVGCDLSTALEEARLLGYAEADAMMDLSGRDSLAKGVILARLAFGRDVRIETPAPCGIEAITSAEVKVHGGTLKLVTRVTREGGTARVAVAPERVGEGSPLAHISGAGNGIAIHLQRSGTVFLSGPGAGGEATAAALMADLDRAVAAAPERELLPAV